MCANIWHHRGDIIASVRRRFSLVVWAKKYETIVTYYTRYDIQCHLLFGVAQCYIFRLTLFFLPSIVDDVL